MSALGKVVRAGVRRRRVQTVVMTLTTMLAVTATVLGVGLLVASHAPFDRAYAQQRGPHLAVQFDPAKATTAEVAATAHASGVTATAGPFTMLSIRPHAGDNSAGIGVGSTLAPMTIVGRADPQGPVDDLQITQGRWATGTGEIVLTSDNAPFDVGDKMTFPDVPGGPTLTVVGLARSVGKTSDAWVSPAQAAELNPSGTPAGYQMLYRFAQAGTDAEVSTDRAAILAVAPQGSAVGVASYLKLKLAAEKTSATFVPFVVAFGILSVSMSVLIISIVVSGAVTAATRRIGILKSVGFTPGQVVRAYVSQALIPGIVGTALGIVLGNVVAIPVMGEASNALGGAQTVLAPWVDVVVPAGVLLIVAVTALVPALRAGRLRTVDALVVGRTPAARRGRLVRRLLGRLPLPRPLSLGLADPFSRPVRAATIAAAVVLGTIGVTFGTGLAISLWDIQSDVNKRSPGQVVVQLNGAPAPPVPGGTTGPTKKADPATIEGLIKAQAGTRGYFSTEQTRLSVAGQAGQTDVILYQGDSSWGAYRVLNGSWFHGPGEAVAPSALLRAGGIHIGDTINLTNNGHSVPVRIVGEVFSLQQVILTDAGSLDGLDAYVLPESIQFNIDLKPGVDKQSYMDTLNVALSPYGVAAQPNGAQVSTVLVSMDSLAAMLTLMLVLVAGLGVLNTVVLDTRERAHDIGIFKALGMSPRQTIAMVLTSVAFTGLVAGAAGVPIGIFLHGYVVPVMGTAAGTTVPPADIAVYHQAVVIPLLLGGLVIAMAGALLPAGWAAKTRTAVTLRSE
jgi:putative ABC transport system permease protein